MLLAVVWFGWRMAGALWLLSGQDRSQLSRPEPQVQTGDSLPPVDTARLAGYAVFRAAAKPAAVSGDPANAPDTSLQLRLDGVFASPDRSRSGAIISEQGQLRGKLYHVGESVAGGATLEAVYPDRVVLVRNGASEVLRFVRTSLLGGDASPSAPSAGGGGKAAQARAMLGTAIERLGSEPGAYLAEMGLVAGGEGYQITEGAPADLRQRLGLRAGDRIVRLNGQSLGNPQLDRQLLEQVRQSGQARVELRRGSQNLTIEQKF